MNDFTPFRDKLHDLRLSVREENWNAIEPALPESSSRHPFLWFWITLLTGALAGGTAVYLAHPWSEKIRFAHPAIRVQESLLDGSRDSLIQKSPYLGIEDQQLAIPLSPASFRPSVMQHQMPEASVESGEARHAVIACQPSIPLASANHLQSPAGSAQSGEKLHDQEVKVLYPEPHPVSLRPANDMVERRIFLPVEPLPGLSTFIPEILPVLPQPRKPQVTREVHCYKFSKKTGNLAWSADWYAGAGFSLLTRTNKGGEFSIYESARNETENPAYAWNTGIRINLQLRNGLAFRTGLEYSQVGDVFDYTDTLATQSTTRIDSFFAADGTFLYADTNRILIFGTLIKKIHNTYRYLDIPLLAGLEIPLRRSMLMLHAGPVLNLCYRQEGEILDPALHPKSITANDPNRLQAYKSTLGISVYLGGGFLFPIRERLSGLVEPRLLYRLHSSTINAYPLREHRHLASISLGLRYHFL